MLQSFYVKNQNILESKHEFKKASLTKWGVKNAEMYNSDRYGTIYIVRHGEQH
ncbi:protein of unknown function [Petrocella atlantisensis]|uniref:Uncharacterized protein n=1 Tax=Petrocella atlantisensis TaxID=2173034 RepID=A0A3P7P0C0_9FIRM|nr:protein of unknown function [Petrocella atlantisensis]